MEREVVALVVDNRTKVEGEVKKKGDVGKGSGRLRLWLWTLGLRWRWWRVR